jgi:hypothetical protein
VSLTGLKFMEKCNDGKIKSFEIKKAERQQNDQRDLKPWPENRTA